jgi:hypothetical protein
MKIESALHPVFADAENTVINLTVKFEELPEPVPFAAAANDGEAHGRALFERALAGEFGAIGPYVPPPPPPPPPPPESVTMRQARLALLGAGLLDAVEAALAAMEGAQGQAARIEWEYATEIRRDNPLFSALAAQLGLTGDALDALFVTAAGL